MQTEMELSRCVPASAVPNHTTVVSKHGAYYGRGEGGRGDGGGGEREIIYLSLHHHLQNDFCIKVGSDESHFNVS